MPRGIAAVLAVLVVAFPVGCGGRAPPPAEREWVANARGLVNQLRGDVVAVSGFDRVGAARVGLRNESQLYGLLVAYSDFGGCRHMVAAVGAEPPGLRHAVTRLHLACHQLEHADRLFTRATAREAPHLLVSATREAVAAFPLLDAAALVLSRRA